MKNNIAVIADEIEQVYHDKLSTLYRGVTFNKNIKKNNPEIDSLIERMVDGDDDVIKFEEYEGRFGRKLKRLIWLHPSILEFVQNHFDVELKKHIDEVLPFLNQEYFLQKMVNEDFDENDTSIEDITDVILFGELRLVRRLNELRPRIYELKACADRRIASQLKADDQNSGWVLMDVERIYEHPFLSDYNSHNIHTVMAILVTMKALGLEKYDGWYKINPDSGYFYDSFINGYYSYPRRKGYIDKHRLVEYEKLTKKFEAIAGVVELIIGLEAKKIDMEWFKSSTDFKIDHLSYYYRSKINMFDVAIKRQCSPLHLKDYKFYDVLVDLNDSYLNGYSTNRPTLYKANVIQDNLKEISFFHGESRAKAFYFLFNSYRTSEQPFEQPNPHLFCEDYFAYSKTVSDDEDFYKEFKFPSKASQRRYFKLDPYISRIMLTNRGNGGYVYSHDRDLKLTQHFWWLTTLWLGETNKFHHIRTDLIWTMKAYLSDLFVGLKDNKAITENLCTIYDLLYSWMEEIHGKDDVWCIRDHAIQREADAVRDFLQASEIKLNENGQYVKTKTKNAERIKKTTTVAKLLAMVEEWHRFNIYYQRELEQRRDKEVVKCSLAYWKPLELELGGYTFKSIDTLKDLLREANQMNHCVYDYKDRYLDGGYVAFSVTELANGERTTLGAWIEDNHLYFNQCYGAYNKLTSKSQIKVCEKLIKAINNKEIDFII